jgi:acyl-CoA thioester hydrolase
MSVPELMLTYRGVVYPWQCDHMGHMNVMWYVEKFDEGTWQLMRTLDLTPAYLRAQNRAMVAADQHITYKRELVAGDTVSVWTGILEMRVKSMRFYHQMRNDVTGVPCTVSSLTERRLVFVNTFPLFRVPTNT